jgi:small subunit ribosomal protein S6
MREYEVTVVLKPDLDDDARNQVLERVEGWLAQGENDEQKLEVDHWGQRTLAYPIRKINEGYYVHYKATLDPTTIHEIQRNILYVDDILRHLLVRKPE